MTTEQIELNGIVYQKPRRPVVVVCIDGGDPDYQRGQESEIASRGTIWGPGRHSILGRFVGLKRRLMLFH